MYWWIIIYGVMFDYHNKEVKRKKMKKIAIAFGIIACLAVLSLLLTSASAKADWMSCPSGWGDLGPPATRHDPATVYYLRDIDGVGKEDLATTIATHDGFTGITAELSARGTGDIFGDRQTIYIDTKPDDPKLRIRSNIDKEYAPVRVSGSYFDIRLSGEICTNNYGAGAVVSEKYRDTDEIAGGYSHDGTGNSSYTQLDRKILGTTRFAVTVKNPDAHHHTVMRSREEHTGLYNISREVDVRVYP
jgi:hypothetical protein